MAVFPAVALLTAAAPAAADEAMAKAKGCTACHALDKKLVGPAYKDVAKKYKGDAKGKDTMVQSILTGSQGKYGPIPMPPNKVTEDEAKKLAGWVLTVQ
jgi:cytochrome c